MSNGEHKSGERQQDSQPHTEGTRHGEFGKEQTAAERTMGSPAPAHPHTEAGDRRPDETKKADHPDRQAKTQAIKRELVERGLTPEMAAQAMVTIEGIIWGS